MNKMIKAVNISKAYYQGRTRINAVRKASFEIAEGEAMLITGPSGAGKSTLLHILGGLDKPTEGKIFFDGFDLYKLGDGARSAIRNEKIGFIFQFYHLLPEFNVLENVMLPGIIGRARKAKTIKHRAELLLEMAGLSRRLQHRPSELSGGECQRVAIARGLINNPRILLCDEPTGNLDSAKAGEVMSTLWRIKEKEKMNIIIVTHDERMEGDFDRAFRIVDGLMEESRNGANSLSEWQVCK
ncbi:MAG: ABC transporter ATP-binding protein [Candidatus Omnitrophica bacterium]|nr:ABC transporter ATP-binding protein [Candidatus Omnitrophota bacterium]